MALGWLWLVSCLSALSLEASRPISHLVLLSSSSLRANKSWLCDKNLNTFSSDTPSPPPLQGGSKAGSFVSAPAAYRFLLITHYNSLSACAACISEGEEEEEEWVKYNSSASARLSAAARRRPYCQLLFFLTNAHRGNQYSCWPHSWNHLLLTANEYSTHYMAKSVWTAPSMCSSVTTSAPHHWRINAVICVSYLFVFVSRHAMCYLGFSSSGGYFDSDLSTCRWWCSDSKLWMYSLLEP